jgi:predicted AAA+ superfamily ATPase
MLERTDHLGTVELLLQNNPIVGVLGARQVGKTTLAQQIAGRLTSPVHRFDLEDPADLARLQDPKLALDPLRGTVILDEVQRRAELFPILRVLADRPGVPARFLVLGSASPELLRQSSETLAGRIAFHELGGFGLDEVGVDSLNTLWLRGGFPRSFLASSDAQSERWRRDFIRTFLERDLARLGIRIPAETLGRFWEMLAHYHGQTWNASELARAFGVADRTINRYLGILEATYVVRRIRPWFQNIGKRQVKAPKVYLADTGLLHALLGLGTLRDLIGHPKVGASWEGLAVDVVVRRLRAWSNEIYFWGLHTGAELDLLVVRGGRKIGFEIKRTSTPRVTPSMRSALRVLELEQLYVIHAGDASFPMGEKIRAVPLARVLEDLKPVR